MPGGPDQGVMHNHGVAEAQEAVRIRNLAEQEAREDDAYRRLEMDQLREQIGTADFEGGRAVLAQYLADLPPLERTAIVEGKTSEGVPFLEDSGALVALVSRAIGPLPDRRADIDAELAQIQGLMRDYGSRYWKGAESAKLQLKYRMLLRAREIAEG